MPNLRSYSCPECGSFLEVDRNKDTFDCPFCGKHFDALDFHGKELFEQANKYLEGRQYELAKKKFEYLLSQDPENFDFLWGYACAVGGLSDLKPSGISQNYSVKLIELLKNDERYKNCDGAEYFAKFAEHCSICNEYCSLTHEKIGLENAAREGIKNIDGSVKIGCGTCFGYLVIHFIFVYALNIMYSASTNSRLDSVPYHLYVYGLPILVCVLILWIQSILNKKSEPKLEARKAPFYQMQNKARANKIQIDDLTERYENIAKELPSLKPKEFRRKAPISKPAPAFVKEKAKPSDVTADKDKPVLCKKCGGVLVHDSAKKLYRCNFCGVSYDYDMFVGDRYTKAKSMLNNNEFDNAYKWYGEILKDTPDDFEANCGRILAALNLRSFLEFKIDRKYDKVNWQNVVNAAAEALVNAPEKYNAYFSMLNSLVVLANEYHEARAGLQNGDTDPALLAQKVKIPREFDAQYPLFIAEDKNLRIAMNSKKAPGVKSVKKTSAHKKIKDFKDIYEADTYYKSILHFNQSDAEAHRGRILCAGGWTSVDDIKLTESFHKNRKDVLAYLAADAKKHTEDPYSEYFNLIGQMVDLCDSYAQMKSEISITKELEDKTAQVLNLNTVSDRMNSPELSELEAKTGRLTAQCAEIEQNFNDIKETVKELDGILF